MPWSPVGSSRSAWTEEETETLRQPLVNPGRVPGTGAAPGPRPQLAPCALPVRAEARPATPTSAEGGAPRSRPGGGGQPHPQEAGSPGRAAPVVGARPKTPRLRVRSPVRVCTRSNQRVHRHVGQLRVSPALKSINKFKHFYKEGETGRASQGRRCEWRPRACGRFLGPSSREAGPARGASGGSAALGRLDLGFPASSTGRE